jgi:hypothetical protein
VGPQIIHSFHSLQAEGKGSVCFLPKNSTISQCFEAEGFVFPRNLVNTELPEARDPHDEMNGYTHTNPLTQQLQNVNHCKGF